MLEVNGFPGLLIAFEGMGGAGKDEQVARLLKRIKLDYPKFTVITTREPGGTPRGEEIRRRLLDDLRMTVEEEVELFRESRSLLYPEVIVPALNKGLLVLQNRWALASCAYQGGGKGYGIKRALERNMEIVKLAPPDIAVFFDVNLEVAGRRFSKNEHDKFDLEGLDFWERTRDAYIVALGLIKNEFPQTEVVVLLDEDGSWSIEETQNRLWQKIFPRFAEWLKFKEGYIGQEGLTGKIERK